MADFKTSYNSIRDRDSTHKCSYTPWIHTYRTSKHKKDRIHLKDDDDNLVFSEEYNCLLPRAPAFRGFSRHEIDDMVSRVVKNTHSTRLRKKLTKKEFKNELSNAKADKRFGRWKRTTMERKGVALIGKNVMQDEKENDLSTSIKERKIYTESVQNNIKYEFARHTNTSYRRHILTKQFQKTYIVKIKKENMNKRSIFEQ